MTRFTRLIALPTLSAGIIGGAALGLAGTAGAAMTVNDDGSMVATPDTVAQPWTGWPRRGYGYYYWPQQGFTPHMDTTVQQSR
ncbi:hypothetical protein Mycch_1262 [Mycolicibacterium chubuense NBB4]|uniref:Uncharacterized protein n=1 Tax=Mycolicibacterium chubuense (strain NBB4) TaxID=710421 RepID=I4BFL3_MYCCN|nr:hypothetical protein [Mycolicibacterium chubuense]AFM16070.1 hypothetical protein Mycch_1262 [Mycolicibacterium chubuense NBB4]